MDEGVFLAVEHGGLAWVWIFSGYLGRWVAILVIVADGASSFLESQVKADRPHDKPADSENEVTHGDNRIGITRLVEVTWDAKPDHANQIEHEKDEPKLESEVDVLNIFGFGLFSILLRRKKACIKVDFAKPDYSVRIKADEIYATSDQDKEAWIVD